MKNTNVRKRNWEWRLSTYERQKQNNLINNNPAEVLDNRIWKKIAGTPMRETNTCSKGNDC